MALNFPNSPGIGSVYTDTTSGFSYEWDGTVWKSYSPASASNIKILDDLQPSFNGSTQTFAITSSNVSIIPANAQSLIITLGGVTQEPGVDYTVSTSNITFTDAPEASLTFSGISLGPAVPITYANDGNIYIRNTYTGAGTTGPFAFSQGYTVGYLDVYRNGVRLSAGTDYVGTSGTNFFLTDAAAVSDEIEAIGYTITSIINASTSFDNINVTGITTTGRLQVTTNGVVSGILTASGGFVGSLTGTASTASFATTSFGLSGSPNIVVGVATASSFVGNVTGTATGLSGTPNITVGTVSASNVVGAAATFTNLTVNGTQTIINTTSLEVLDKNIGIGSTSSPSDALADGSGITVYGTTNKTLTYNDTKKGFETNVAWATTDTRLIGVAEKLIVGAGNNITISYGSTANIGFATNPTGDITVAVAGIPTTSDFDNHVISFSVFVNQTGTARSCTAVTLNGVSRTIRWAGGSLANAVSGVTTTNGYDIFSFTGINTIGSASTTTNYQVLGVVNGGFA